MSKRYIIIDESRGVFLGSHATSIFDNQPQLDDDIYDVQGDNKLYALFANHNPFEVSFAPTFKSVKAACYYIEQYMSNPDFGDLKTLPVESEDEYASLVEIIKSGHEQYTYDMLNTLFPVSSLAH